MEILSTPSGLLKDGAVGASMRVRDTGYGGLARANVHFAIAEESSKVKSDSIKYNSDQ